MALPFNKLPPLLKQAFGNKAAWDNVPEDVKTKLVTNFAKKLQDRGSSDYKTENDAGTATEDLGTFSDIATARVKDAEVAMTAMRNIAREGAFFAQDGPFLKGLSEAIRMQNQVFAQPKEGAEAYRNLAVNVQQFNKLTKDSFNIAGNFTAKLADQAATLEKLGLSNRQFSENLQTAIYDLGMSQKGVEGFNMSIKQLANDLDMLPDQVSRNFRSIASNLMYESSMIKEEYAKLEILAQKTGMSASDIASKFGTGMDTIGGASSAAANLNAMLGRNAFSATQLLGMTESERANAVREAIQADANIMADIQAGGVQGKFAMVSVAEALGMDRSSARRFIQTGERDSVRSKIEDAVDSDEKIGKMDAKILVENFKNPAKNLEEAIDKLRQQVEQTMTRDRVTLLQTRRSQLNRAQEGEFGMAERLGRISQIGFLQGDATQQQFSRILRDPSAAADFNEIQRGLQMGTVQNEEADRITRLLSSQDERERRRGSLEARQLSRRKQTTFQDLEEGKIVFSPVAMSVIQKVRKANNFAGRILFRKAMELAQSGQLDDETAKNIENDFDTAKDLIDKIEEAATSGEVGARDKLRTSLENLRDAEFSSGIDLKSSASAELSRMSAADKVQQKLNDERIAAETTTTRSRSQSGGTTGGTSDKKEGDTINFHVAGELIATIKDVRGRVEVNKEKIDRIEQTAAGR